MFDPLDRPTAHYDWVLKTWAQTPGLDHSEATLIRALQTALDNSLDEFDQLRRIAVQPAFLNTLKSAAAKAIAAGHLKDWSEYAEPA